MGVGFVADDEDEDSDVQQARDYLAGGTTTPDVAIDAALDLDADALTDEDVTSEPLVAEPEVPQQGAVAADGPHTPVAAGSTPAPATSAYPPAPQFPELGPPPPPPAFTGDPQKDVALNAAYQRSLVDHHGELTKRQTALAQHAAAVGAMRGQKEAEVAAVEAREKKAEIARAKLARDARATQINEAVNARLAAARDVEGFKWDRPHTGREIAAILIGGFAAGLGNVAAIQAGHAPSNQNEGLKGINDRMKREYDAKRARLAQAGDNVLMARHGAKDAQEAHRAAMNDLDADFAARYRAIAREADEQLRRAGVPEAQVKGNVVLVDALQKAAAHEGDIHNREEGHRDQRQQAAATLALARANLGERKREFDDRLADKKLAREEKKESKSLQDQARVDGIVQKVIQNTGYKESAAQNAKYNQMARTLSGATTNAALAAAGAGQFVKMAQGGTGVISDSDMDLFWKRVGGKLSGAAVDQFINDWTNGNMAPAKAKIVGDAIRQLAKGALAELDRIGGQIETRLQGVAENTPWVAKEIPVYLDTYVPGMRQRRTAAAGSTITAPGGIKYELGADGKYHKVK